MHQARQYLGWLHLLEFQLFSYLPDVLQKSLEWLTFLVAPVDTTDSAPGRGEGRGRVETWNVQSIAKATFWIVMAIILSLAIGQLR